MSWITLLCMQIQLLLLRLLNLILLLPVIILAPLVAVVAKLQFLTPFSFFFASHCCFGQSSVPPLHDDLSNWGGTTTITYDDSTERNKCGATFLPPNTHELQPTWAASSAYAWALVSSAWLRSSIFWGFGCATITCRTRRIASLKCRRRQRTWCRCCNWPERRQRRPKRRQSPQATAVVEQLPGMKVAGNESIGLLWWQDQLQGGSASRELNFYKFSSFRVGW